MAKRYNRHNRTRQGRGESAEMAIYDAEAKTFVPPVHSFGVGRRFAVAGLISWATASFRRRSVDKQLPVDRFRSLGFSDPPTPPSITPIEI